MVNIFDFAHNDADNSGKNRNEQFDSILSGAGGLLVERIVSYGNVTPEGEWYDQDKDEWVVVLEGEARLSFADGSTRLLVRGDHMLLPRHCRHRVVYTSLPCVWLAVHYPSLVVRA